MTGRKLRLPDFLIIGAMKAGTTTLYRDMLLNPAIFMPKTKEPKNLCDDAILTDAGQSAYAKLFKGARAHQRCGEASTDYSKLPDRPGVPKRAKQVLGPDARIIYLVREPVARIISHHYHSYVTGKMGSDINREVHEQPRLLDYSRYAMQAQPWIETFGSENILITVFEEFVANRRKAVDLICRFLGVESDGRPIGTSAFNRSEGKPVDTPFWSAVRRSGMYRRYVQPRLPLGVRDRAREAFLPKAPPRPDPPNPETIEFIWGSLQADIRILSDFMGRDDPIWS